MKSVEEKRKEIKAFIAENFFIILVPKEAPQHLFNAKIHNTKILILRERLKGKENKKYLNLIAFNLCFKPKSY